MSRKKTHRLGYVIPALANSVRERKKLKCEGNDNLRNNCAKANQQQEVCFLIRQKSKPKAHQGLASTFLSAGTLCLLGKQVHGPKSFTNDKNKLLGFRDGDAELLGLF